MRAFQYTFCYLKNLDILWEVVKYFEYEIYPATSKFNVFFQFSHSKDLLNKTYVINLL
jgi:hypothetical protein